MCTLFCLVDIKKHSFLNASLCGFARWQGNKPNQNTQEVKNECSLISTRQNNVHIFDIYAAYHKATNGQTDIKEFKHEKGGEGT